MYTHMFIDALIINVAIAINVNVNGGEVDQ